MFSDYTYLFGALLSLLIWIVLFLLRKDIRKEMLSLSAIICVFGLIMEWLIWTKDWWRPVTFTHTLVGFEDLIFGFAMGGIAAVIYEEIFKQKIARLRKGDHPHTKQLSTLLLLSLVLGNFSYFILDLNSAGAWIISIIIPTILIWYMRPDLVKNSLLTGIILTVLAIAGFWLLDLVEPGFVHKWWLFDHLSGVILLKVPLEDIFWFFTLGMFVGPIYEFWQGTRLQRIKNYHRTAK